MGIIFFSLVALTLLNGFSLGSFHTTDLLIYSFWGFEKQGNLMEFLGLLLFNGLPLYLMGIVLAEDSLKNPMVIIRFKNKRQNLNNYQKSSFLYFGGYVLLQLILVFGIGYLGSHSQSESILLLELQDMMSWQMGWEYLNISNLSPLLIGLILGCIRMLELMMMQMLFLTFKALAKETVTAFLAVMGLYGLMFLVGGYFPIGISSFIRIMRLNPNFYTASLKAGVILLATYGINYFYMIITGYKKLF